MRNLFIGILLTILYFPLSAQSDSLILQNDSIKKDFVRHSPGKAALYSAVLPGLGQAYNKKFWKIPIVYAGLGGLAFAIQFNASRHRCYKNAYRAEVDNDTLTSGSCNGISNTGDLQILRDFYRRNLDLAVLGTILWYGLQIIDAVVDAHLYEFRFDETTSLGIDPQFQFYGNFQAYTGLKITLHL